MEGGPPMTQTDEKGISGTALGPADVRDTPHVKPAFSTTDDETEEEEEDLWLGRTLSNVYQVEKKIGEGGMGSVYLARHIHLQKTFAIKVLVDSIAGKNNAVERLKQEAMAAANIDHENIVDVVNFDRTDDGAVFIVMEHLKGESLADCIGRGPIELHRALPITYQICRALHAAHEHGIVHRDLKPENVFLTEKGGRTLVKVLDFGISKVKRADAEEVRMTKTGQLVGTPLYMSPEQARGETEIDRRVDIYAMGVILFEMITGALPFLGRNYFELLWKHGNEPPPSMRETNPNVHFTDEVDEIVLRALAKDPAERYQTMEEFEQDLMRAAPDVPSLPALASLPPERPRQGVRTSRESIGEAQTEAIDSSSLDQPRERSTTEATIPTRKAWPTVALAIGALLVVGALVFALRGTGPEPTSPIAGPAPEEPAPATLDPAADPPAGVDPPAGIDPPPARVSVHLTSNPEGASVRIGDRELGATPLATALDVGDDPVVLTFERDGYLAQTITVVPLDGVEVPEVRLRRRRRVPPPGRRGGGGSLQIKTGM